MKIILMTTHCPKCKVLETKLKQKNIQYTELNNVDKLLKLGITSVPQLSVNGKILDFITAIKWVNEQ